MSLPSSVVSRNISEDRAVPLQTNMATNSPLITTPSQTLSLMTLPAEIRQTILCMVSGEMDNLIDIQLSRKSCESSKVEEFDLSIKPIIMRSDYEGTKHVFEFMKVCKVLYQESIPVIFRHHSFSIQQPSRTMMFLRPLGTAPGFRPYEYVRHLHLDLDVIPPIDHKAASQQFDGFAAFNYDGLQIRDMVTFSGLDFMSELTKGMKRLACLLIGSEIYCTVEKLPDGPDKIIAYNSNISSVLMAMEEFETWFRKMKADLPEIRPNTAMLLLAHWDLLSRWSFEVDVDEHELTYSCMNSCSRYYSIGWSLNDDCAAQSGFGSLSEEWLREMVANMSESVGEVQDSD